MTVLYPFLFLFVQNTFQLILVAIFSGIAWSGFDLTAFNYLLDVTPPDKRHSYVANYKMVNGFALFMGPFLGGLISEYLDKSAMLWLNGLQVLFLISFVLRAAVTAYGLPKIREVRAKRTLPAYDVFIQAFAKYPLRGLSHEVVYLHKRLESVELGLRNRMGR
jgi:MFS family permease